MCNGTIQCDKLPSLTSDCDTVLNNKTNTNNTDSNKTDVESSKTAGDSVSQTDSENRDGDNAEEKMKSNRATKSADVMWSTVKTKSGTPFTFYSDEKKK